MNAKALNQSASADMKSATISDNSRRGSLEFLKNHLPTTGSPWLTIAITIQKAYIAP